MEGLRLPEYAPTDKDSLSGPDPLPERTPSITEVTKAPITYYPSSANPDLFSTGFESVSNIGAGPRARARGAMETAVIELLEDTEEDESPEYESFVRGTFGAIVEGVEKRRASLKVSLNSDLERKKQSMGFRGLFSREKVEERSLDLVHRDIDQDVYKRQFPKIPTISNISGQRSLFSYLLTYLLTLSLLDMSYYKDVYKRQG